MLIFLDISSSKSEIKSLVDAMLIIQINSKPTKNTQSLRITDIKLISKLDSIDLNRYSRPSPRIVTDVCTTK